MKQLLSLALAILMLITAAGCKVKIPDPTPEPEPPVISPEPESASFDITLSFLGDMLLACQKDITVANSFNEYADKYPADYFLEKVRPILEADDFTVANLENVLTDRDLTPIEKDYEPAFWFKSKTKNIEILSGSSIDAVLLNNNHTEDYGDEGYFDTVNAVKNAGMQHGGNGNDEIIYFEKQGFKIAVLCTPLWSSWNATHTCRRLEDLKDTTDYQIIFFHGGTEKVHAPEQMKIEAAHKFVDAGADLVVGSHPHVLQPREIYNGVEIIYSLGNFCYGGHRKPENRTVIYQATITVCKESKAIENVTSNIIPCYVYTESLNNYQPAPIENEAEKQRVLDFMNGKADSPI